MTSTKIATGLSAAVVWGVVAFGFVLIFVPAEKPNGVAAATPAESAATAVAPAAESAPAADPGACTASAHISIGIESGEPMHAEMQGADLMNLGQQEFAAASSPRRTGVADDLHRRSR